MSKITPIQFKYQPTSNQKQTKFAQNPSFGTKWDDLPDGAREIIENGVKAELDNKSMPVGWLFEKIGKYKGEIQTQIINNIFTATLAPLVIYYNPFTNKPQEDRAYLAYRQPISAFIAMTGGLSMTLAINSYLTKSYDEGLNKVIDLRWNPSKGYLRKQFKKEHYKTKLPFLFWSENKKAEFEKYSKTFNDKRVTTFAQLLGQDPGKDNCKFKIDEKTKIINYINENGEKIEIGKNIPNLDTKEQLTEFIEKNNFYNRSVGDLLGDEFEFEFYKKGHLKSRMKADVAEKIIGKTLALDFIKVLGLVDGDKVDDSKFRAALSRFRQAKDAPEYAKSLYGKKSKKFVKRANEGLAIIGKEGSRSNEWMSGEGPGKETSTSLSQFLHQIGYKLSPSKEGDKRLEDLMTKKINVALVEFKQLFKKHKLEGFDIDSDMPAFAKNMLNRLAKRNESYSKNHMSRIGMFLNIVVVMITCSILNEVFPVYMDKHHPDLAASHRKAEGN